MFKYGIAQLTLHKVKEIANGNLKATIDSTAKEKIISCRKKVETITKNNKVVYGINTGFGPLCDVQISPEQNKPTSNQFINYTCCWCWEKHRQKFVKNYDDLQSACSLSRFFWCSFRIDRTYYLFYRK